jgi:3-hydroxyisobutyrate dehydrogenase
MRIGFVGLGLMGLPMATQLLRAGHQLFVASASQEALRALVAQGAQVCGSAREAAAQSELFLSCRVTPEHSLQTFLGEDGALASGRQGLLCVDLATTTPPTARSLEAALAAAGMGFVDAPVSGGPRGAADASLTFLVGGQDAAVRQAEPLLRHMGRQVLHMGPAGAGVATKLCNNMVSITTHALLAEAMVMGVKAGVQADRLYEALHASSAFSRTLERVVPQHFLPRNFKAAASLVTIMKDLQCAIDTGRELGVRLLLANVAMQAFVDAAGRGHLHEDIASVILPMEEIAGVRVAGRAADPPA